VEILSETPHKQKDEHEKGKVEMAVGKVRDTGNWKKINPTH